MTDAAANGQPGDLLPPFQVPDTVILDEEAVRAMREALELHRLAIQALRGQGRDDSEAYRIVSQLTDDELRTVVRGPASCGHQPRALPTPGER